MTTSNLLTGTPQALMKSKNSKSCEYLPASKKLPQIQRWRKAVWIADFSVVVSSSGPRLYRIWVPSRITQKKIALLGHDNVYKNRALNALPRVLALFDENPVSDTGALEIDIFGRGKVEILQTEHFKVLFME